MANIERLRSLRETAALWHERSSEENASAETRNDLMAWLAKSPEHVAAYESIEQTWSQLNSAAAAPQILQLRHESAMRLTHKTAATLRPLRWTLAAALILLSLGGALWILLPNGGFSLSSLAWLNSETQKPIVRTYATKTGDRLTIALEDGSQVTLNTETQLDVAFTKTSRTVSLSRGQALFEVAKDKSRPFAVRTENRRFVAVGTAFDVHIETGQIKVTMLEGTVHAESLEPGSLILATVTAGEQLITGAHAQERVRRVDPERETSWRRGQIIFDNTPLGAAIEELNRYSSTHIELADSKLAELRLSGTFATGSTSTFVEAVTAYFPIQIEHADARMVTLKARD
jgi:transmembrane sensor